MSKTETGKLLVKFAFVVFLVLLQPGCNKKEHVETFKAVERIISCAPSITETLFALGLGNRVVGVTNYCKYPRETEFIEKIGGYTDINLEKVVSMKPDIVILQPEHEKQRIFLKHHGIAVLSVNNKTFAGICSSFIMIGNACGALEKAENLVSQFKESMGNDDSSSTAPKVMMCIGRDNPCGKNVQNVFIVSTATFYDDLIKSTGGVNAFPDSLPHYPNISREGIISIAPEIIIDLASPMNSCACSTLVEDWYSLPMLPAVKNKRVFCISGDYATIPGPRILLLLRDLQRMIQSTGSVKS